MSRQFLRNFDVLILNLVLISYVDKSLQFVYLLLLAGDNAIQIEVSLLSEISLGDQSGSELVDVAHKVAVEVDFKLLCLSDHVINSLYVLSNIFVVIVVALLVEEIFNF